MHIYNSLNYASCNIAFRRKSIEDKNIKFNNMFGPNAKWGNGSDTIFIREVLKIGEVIISRIYLVYKMDINLQFGDNTVNMVYVKGNGRISNFYMSNAPIVDSENKPRTYLSYRDICKLLTDWAKEYDILFKLPTVKQWMYAAKGGINQDNVNKDTNFLILGTLSIRWLKSKGFRTLVFGSSIMPMVPPV